MTTPTVTVHATGPYRDHCPCEGGLRTAFRAYHRCTKTLKARVDEPSQIPEGTEIELAMVDPGDQLDAEERAALQEALRESWASALRGETRRADELLLRLRKHDG